MLRAASDHVKWIWQLVIGAGVLGTLDAIWLKGPGGAIYREQLGNTLRVDSSGALRPLWPAAILVYVLLLLGLMVFVAPRAGSTLVLGLGFGAVFGLVVYGVYDFTNLALVSGWTLQVAIVDVIWGAVLGAVTGAAMTLVAR